MTETTLVALLLAGGPLAPAPAPAVDVNIGINVAPPPALVVASLLRLRTVPGSPVFYGPREPGAGPVVAQLPPATRTGSGGSPPLW